MADAQSGPPGGRRKQPKNLPRWASWLLTLGVIFGSIGLIWQSLPGGGFSTDLSRIGQGEPVAVLTHETANPTSMGVMDEINALGAEEHGGVEFLVADLGTPEGQDFAERLGVSSPGILFFFDGQGEMQEALAPPESAEEIATAARSVADGRY